ncbi:MAG: N-acetylneuraminate synthase [Thermoanaerobacterales bacterium]|nr:N-acetylneuraminate synthase [Bacillota bacterium]MDI6906149.1 N-acetylneuraminate synthase [Thermoanaerobacterales bacterium]
MVGKDRVFIIAEGGVNHNGDPELARRLVDTAREAGADAVKFQTFAPEQLVAAGAARAAYQQANMPDRDESQLEMIRRLALSGEAFRELKEYCDRAGIMFLSTPFDYQSVDLLYDLGVPLFKVGSGELTNYPLLEYIAGKGKPVIVSTGMATLGEVEQALVVVREAGAQDVTLLHCTSSYPTPYEDVNLRAMVTLERAFGVPVGYSDHTPGFEVAVAAAALGARVVEKHFTLDRNLEGPDHKASLEPGELTAMVRAIRHVEAALGDGFKRATPAERDTIRAARRSLVAARHIVAGELITADNLTLKRPGTGIPPAMWDIVIGRRARVDIPADTVLTWEMV